MIKKFRKKLTVVIAAILFLVFAAQITTVDVINYQDRRADACRTAEMIAERYNVFGHSGGEWKDSPDFMSPEGYYVLLVNSIGSAELLASDGEVDLSEKQLLAYLNLALKKEDKSGIVDDMFFAVSESPWGRIVVLTDNAGFERSVGRMLFVSGLLMLISALLSYVVARSIAGQTVKPVERGFAKQKQFISDAGHELKTPLTVIGANAELLENEIGDNKWLGYIRSEAARMNDLVLNLLTLAKLDNAEDAQRVYSSFDLSKTVEGMAMTFESVAFENGVQLDTDIDADVTFVGNQAEIRQLASILIDNAIKHSKSGGTITVALKKGKAKGKNRFSVSNEGEAIPLSEREKIFERFYRVDEARTGSENRFGLGLAIAKSITENHKGSISVDCMDGVTTFTALL